MGVRNASKRNISQKTIKMKEVKLNLITDGLGTDKNIISRRHSRGRQKEYITRGFVIRIAHQILPGVCGGAVGCGTALQSGRSRVRLSMGPLRFFIDFFLPTALCPWGRLRR